MNKRLLPLFVLVALSNVHAADYTWVLKESTLTYHVSHPLHQTDGVSHAARGKGICHDGQCDFLIAVPVKSFDSGDSNRDLHMIQVTRGAEFPMVTVRTRLAESASGSSTIKADLEIQFAGQTMHYQQIAFEVTAQENEKKIIGHHSRQADGFQNRTAVAVDHASEERYSDSSGDGVESKVAGTSRERSDGFQLH